ncbi:vacuolar membrane pq loop repeat protein [Sporothrix schenckii 1099-18]|uniref:Vacuolar membrane pq loop repeat protein n=1 Tax=Sporothrix schenckii 1099-18 TaxID=1397361 RepID=A0A0F2LYZ8_SPOSC|nr:vacuolar membrane pq loop repeat protein [Sporothrix schenckii 1099-18]KJR82692.1 vacuolar membrane pq loop repeat protein [Sporothrix schenckii 1099-18]
MVVFRVPAAATLAARSAAVAAAALQSKTSSPEPTIREALSGIFGSVSLTAWICLLLPQLIQNYKGQSADGLSMAFLFVWLLGDATNLSGALWTGLAPTAVALAFYFCIADIVLITQCLYYNTKSARRDRLLRQGRTRRRSSSTAVAGQSGDDDVSEEVISEEGEEDEDDSPLLARRRSSSIGLPGSHRRHSIRRSESSLDPLRRIITGEDETPDSNPWLHNTLSLVAVWIVGALGYFVSYRMGAWDATDPVDGGGGNAANPAPSKEDDVYAKIGLALGYCSAVFYLCARIPQILKNYREKSCEGLALLFFLLSLTGNFTYGASLVAYSQDGKYLLNALPWLLGSLGTIVEDVIIFFQFRLYSPKRNAIKPTAGSSVNGSATSYGTV